MINKNMKTVWIVAVVINVALAVLNASTGNTGGAAFNALCAVACQYGYIQLKNHE
jgi:threonine synthase